MRNIVDTPDKLIGVPTQNADIESFECILKENPVCKPITETNRAVPNFENIYSVLWEFTMI